MKTTQANYKAIVSSDWNQCLAPCGPFDPIIFCYPHLSEDLSAIFKAYTGNKISLGQANRDVWSIIPAPLAIAQMDNYLDACFRTYRGVPELISWCKKNKILFMINTTGMIGYFQRVFAKHLLPAVPVLSANPMLRYPSASTDPPDLYELSEVEDKGRNTDRALHAYSVSEKSLVIIGDSGGDGPHFQWGKQHQAYVIGSMAKQSLIDYCRRNGIEIDLLFGPIHDEERGEATEMAIDFMELSSILMDMSH